MSNTISRPGAPAWWRESRLGACPGEQQQETWTYHPTQAGGARRFELAVRTGKPFDVLALKGTDLGELREYADFLAATARRLYAESAPRERQAHCPCCGAATDESALEWHRFFGIALHRCAACGHGFVLEQPARAAFEEVFATSETHSAVYVDRASLETRVREIVTPKLDWVLETYRARYQSEPRQAVDVGAGGGHFVEACRRAGIQATGFELSATSRRFARDAFEITLDGGDFTTSAGEPLDLVTFWGLLEYTPAPRRFLDAARRRLDPRRGLLVVEVPRVDCGGSAVQRLPGAVIARHLDPTSHVNTFTDESLATLLVESGFAPVAAWYFGMDAYELLVQCAMRLQDAQIIDKLADAIPALQDCLDRGRQCDDIVVAAVPIDSGVGRG